MITHQAGAYVPIGFAHRGARSERENTTAAFRRALELGATGLESDAWATADGVVVLHHDGSTGPPWRRRPISLQRREELPAHIPSLSDLYESCGTGFELSLDVKDPEALEAIVETGRRVSALPRLWLCHDDWRTLASWRSATGGAHLVQSTRLRQIREGIKARAATLREAGVEVLNMRRDDWTEALVIAVHEHGISAFAWNAQTSRQIRDLINLGIDGLYSDHLERLMAGIRAGRG